MTVAAGPTARAASAGGVLAATCISTLVVNANTSAVSILLPSISADVHASVESLQWAVTGYSLVGAAVIVTSGALGDVFGRRRVFLAGIVLFIASCVLIALANSGGLVIAGRAIQGAAGSTILACGLSLLSVANSGAAQLKAVSLWGAASAVGAAAGPLLGGVLVEATGWQGLFWIDAAVAAICIPVTLASVSESSDPDRPRSIDFAGTVLVAAILVPFVLALSKGTDWGWASPLTLGCFVITAISAVSFVVVERRVAAPLVDLALLRNAVLVGATLSILIAAGTINALMYLLSLYFQQPETLGLSALQTGLATLPATVGLVAIAAVVPRLAARLGTRLVIAAGFAVTGLGFLAVAFVDSSWAYGRFVLPLLAIAIGMGLSNGPASSAATAAVSADEVGAASGISNMARYVGAAVATALAATIYATVGAHHRAAGSSTADSLAAGLSRAAILMAIFSAAGVALALLMARHRPTTSTVSDSAVSVAGVAHTVPVTSSPHAGAQTDARTANRDRPQNAPTTQGP